MRRSHVLTPLILVAAFACGLPGSAFDDSAEQSEEASFRRVAERYLTILKEHPRQGVAFDRWYRHFLDAGRLDDLVTALEDAGNFDDFATQMLLGFVSERRGDLNGAQSAYEAADAIDRQQFVAPYSLGLLHLREGRYAAAADCLSRAMQQEASTEESLDVHQQSARAYLRLGRREEALAILQKLANEFPVDLRVLRQVALFLDEEGQLAESIVRWEQVAEIPDQDRWYRVEARMQIADLRARMDEAATAVLILDETLQDVRPGSWLAETLWDRIERVFQRQDDAGGFVEYCRKRVENQREDLDARLRLAQALASAGEHDPAIAELRTSVGLAPGRRDIREELIHQLVVSNAIQEAIDECEVLVEQNPDDADLLARLGELRLESGDGQATEQAIDAWRRLADIREDDPLYAVRAAELCHRSMSSRPVGSDAEEGDRGRGLLIAAAEELYREATTRSPDDDHLHQYLGEFLHEQGRREDAVEAFSQIAAGEDVDAADWRELANVFESVGYLAEAIGALDAAIARQPDQFDWRVLRFDVLLRQEAFDRADEDWHELMRLADTAERQEMARARRVTFQRVSERIDREINRLQTVHDLGVATTDDLWILGLLLSDQWRHNDAREAFEAAVATAPDDVPLLRDYAAALQHSGNLARAVRLLRRIVELDLRPRLQDYEQIASLELRLGEYPAVRQTIQRLLELAPDRQATHVLLADLEFQTDAPEAELSALRRAVQLAPRDIDIRARLADALGRHGRSADAIEHYWRCFELTGELDEQRSLVAAMCVAGSDVDRARIFERLRRLRAQAEDPRSLTLCLVQALRVGERPDEARRELERLLASGGRDLEALRELAAISRLQRAWSDAADYQEQVAAITETDRDLRLLLRYYRNAERHDDATRLWETLLDSDDPEVYIDEVDRFLSELEFNDAVSLVEIGLSKAPGDWRLHLRAAYARMLRAEFALAGTHFEAVAQATLPASQFAPPGSGPVTATGNGDPLQELVSAKSSCRDLRRLMMASMSPQRWQQQQLSRYLQGHQIADNAKEAYVNAVVGSYLTEFQRGPSAWIEERRNLGETDRRFWRQLIWIYAATGTLPTNRAFVNTYIEQLPHDPLPHLARLEQIRDLNSVNHLTPDDRVADREGLIESYHWVLQHRPSLKADIVYRFGTVVLLLGGQWEAVSAFIDCLEHPSETVRKNAAIALRQTGDESWRSIPHLIDRLSDSSSEVEIESATTLGLIGPNARAAISPLIETFEGDSVALRNEAALALGRIGVETIPNVTAALHHGDADGRLGAVLALYHLGRQAAPAMQDLIRAVHDESPEVQHRAVMALANFGADAEAAVPDLIDCLGRGDKRLLVAAADTLASIGPAAQESVPVLVALLSHDDQHVRHMSGHALRRIDRDAAELHLGPLTDATAVARADIGTLDVGGGDWPQWGGWSGRNNTPAGTDIPANWDIESGLNIKWQAPLGTQTYGNPSIANGRVFIGTNNGHGYLPRFPRQVDLGVMLCFDEQTGSFLWQYSSPKLSTGLVHDWPKQGMPSTPLVDGERLWAVTNRCEVVCLDTEGFMDGENDGPFTGEAVQNSQEADVIWKFDMMGELGVSPHNMSTCCILTMGGKLFVCTSNGVDESHVRIPAPNAPSFIAMDRETGGVLWTDNSPGTNLLHGQWASPTWGVFDGQPQIVFPGGDGWLYSFDPAGDGQGNSRLLWKFDANPKEALYSVRGRSERNHMIGFACNYDGLLYFAVGEDPEHGEGSGHLWCINPAHRTDGSDVSAELAVDATGNPLPQRRLQAVVIAGGEIAIPNPDSAVVWHFTGHDINDDGKLDYEEQMHRTLGTPAIKDDLLYVVDFSGIVHCIDVRTAQSYWTYDMFSQSWGSPLVVDDKVYVGNEEGGVIVFEHSTVMNILAENDLLNSVYTTPIVANNVLFVTNKKTLFAIAAPEAAETDEVQ